MIPPNAHVGTPTLNANHVIHGVGPKEIDPLELGAIMWPKDKWADYQRKIVYSVWDNIETTVKAGNKLGKDWLGGFIAPIGFLTRHPCRIVTTSAKDQHLRVLWGEIGQRIRTSTVPLDVKRGGPLIINHQDIRKMVDGERCPLSYLTGMVAGEDSMASMQGHHIAKEHADDVWKTMFMCDEASSVNHEYYRMARSWFHRAYIFGNPWPCNNFFYHAFKGSPGTEDKGGDTYRDDRKPEKGYARKTFTLRAEDSPNVRLGMAEVAAGKEPSQRILVPGLKPYDEYVRDRRSWDKIQQCVSLDGEFYEGAEVRMFPQDWLTRSAGLSRQWGYVVLGISGAALIAGKHPGTGKPRIKARGVGVDCAAGGDKTAMAATDECGVLEVQSKKTPDTNIIVGEVEAFVRKWDCDWENVYFDISGGGKQHADRLRAKGYNIRTIAFGGKPADEVDLLHTQRSDRKRSQDIAERKMVYANRRAEMYGNLRELLDPALLTLDTFQRAQALKAIMGHGYDPDIEFFGFSIPIGVSTEPAFQSPDAFAELHRQMGPIPLTYTEEGIIWLIPKHPRDKDDDRPNLTALLGCSPDELDAVVLAVHAFLRPPKQALYL